MTEPKEQSMPDQIATFLNSFEIKYGGEPVEPESVLNDLQDIIRPHFINVLAKMNSALEAKERAEKERDNYDVVMTRNIDIAIDTCEENTKLKAERDKYQAQAQEKRLAITEKRYHKDLQESCEKWQEMAEDYMSKNVALTAKVEELTLYDYRQFIPEGSDCVDCRFCDYVDYEDTGYESYYTCPIVGRRLFDIAIRENDCPKPAKGENDG